MYKLLLIPGIVLLVVSIGCGSDNGGGSGGGGFGSGGSNGFSDASLSGQYAYQVSGFDFASSQAFRETGVLTADGKGNITSGTDDLAEGSQLFSDGVTGTYNVTSDGTGTAILSFSGGGLINFAISVASPSKILLTLPVVDSTSAAAGFDVSRQGFGIALKQDTTAIATIPSGNFAFGSHTVSSTQGSSAIAGAFTLNGGVLSGSQDVLRAGVLTSHTLTGLFNTPDTSGRGTATFTDELDTTSTFNYYVVDASTMFLFSTANGVAGNGRAEKQSATSFALASLTGNYAFGSRGDTGSLDSVNTVGRFTAGGDGTITAGAFDAVQDGTPASNIGFTGIYTLATNGRAVLSFTPTSGSAIEQIAWLVSPTRAFFLVNDLAKAEDGTIDGQQSGAFSNSSLNGTFVFVTDGFNSMDSFDRLGTMAGDGAGNLKFDYALTEPTLLTQAVSLTGTYAVSSNGRATGSVANLSSNLVFYLISGSDGYILQGDSATQMAGSFTKQQ
jgi:hypothetical protein